jgi:alginate O-acetyltransferase complex protein AlgJ
MRAPLVILFVTIVTLPLAANLAGHDGGDPHAEHRQLAPFPPPPRTREALAAYPDAFSAWFGDHFGFRSTFVRWSGEARLDALGVSPSPTVVRGRDGWFFFADDHAIDDYACVDPLTPNAIANWRMALVRAHAWLHRRGIPYLFTIAPDKHVLYGEEMPASLARVNDLSHTDQVLTAVQDYGFAIDLRAALFEAKARERIYQRTDTHWNDRGAFVAYQQIIRGVRARFASVPPPWERGDFDAVTRDVEAGDLAGLMGLRRVLREEDLVLVPKRARQARVIEPAGAAPSAEEGYLVTEIPGSTLLRALVFRDSFVSQLAPFLSEHFSRTVYVWQNDFDPSVVEREHPDVVIQEIVGRHLYDFIPSPELVP